MTMRKKFDLPDMGIKPDRAASVSILDDNIQNAIDTLQNKYKESLILRDIEGMSYKHIADITGVPVGTVKSRVNRARKKLQKKLRGHTPEDELFQ